MPESKIGFYSKQAHALADLRNWPIEALRYRIPSGEEVLATAVYPTQEQGEAQYRWPDAVCVGPVTEYLGPADAMLRARSVG